MNPKTDPLAEVWRAMDDVDAQPDDVALRLLSIVDSCQTGELEG